MLENYARIKDFPALPRLRMGKVQEFFAGLPDRQRLPKYVGELYLELHRGTLTTQARSKLYNRIVEQRLVEAEAFGALASSRRIHATPPPTIQTAWKTLLLNQFHDILPGSSIHEVYEDTHREMQAALEAMTSVRDTALGMIAGSGSGGGFLVANAGLADRPIAAFLPGVTDGPVALADGTPLSTQSVDGGLLVGGSEGAIPGLGWKVIKTGLKAAETPLLESPVHARESNGGAQISNDEIRVTIGADGTIAGLYDKAAHREALAGAGNQLVAYVDKPRSWDAWDIDETYERDAEELTAVDSIEVLETGPLRASVRVSRTFRSSTIVQTYRLQAGSRRLDIETDIQWHERQVLLRTRFPLLVRSHEATYETMYGAFRRASHRNTTFEQARFEVGAQRWVDMSEPGYGVALINNGKYGHGALDNVLSISLVRGPMYPDWLADEGEHHFTYSVYPHMGDWTTSNLIAEAQALNSPLVVTGAGADAVDAEGFVTVEGVELALGALKPALDGNGTILRVYEPHGMRGTAKLIFRDPVATIERVNLLEDPAEGAEITASQNGQSASVAIRPFEVLTLRLT